MADDLIIFSDGQKITAEDTNDNNRYLKSLNTDSISTLQTYIDGQLAQIQANMTTQISNLNTQISSVQSLANSKIGATFSGNSCKLSNGMTMQWGAVGGMGNGSDVAVTLPVAFTYGNYAVAGAASYGQSRGDKRSTWYAYDTHTTYFRIQSRFEEYGNNVIWWVAIGT